MFHVKDGLFFDRLDNGTVRVVATSDGMAVAEGGANVALDVTMDAAAWCSVIASMSAYGEDGGGWERAKAFHAEEQQT